MNEDLVVQAAQGQSILRLPWFEDGLFVGRQLPEISEMPTPVRRLCVENYTAALAGERGRFAFTSYGHAYSVDAVPVRGRGRPHRSGAGDRHARRTTSPRLRRALRTAERLDRSAELAEKRAERHRLAGRSDWSSPNCTQPGMLARARSEPGRTRSACAHVTPPSPETPIGHVTPGRGAQPRLPRPHRRLRSPSSSPSASPPSRRTSTTSTPDSA